jgi:ribonuclease J
MSNIKIMALGGLGENGKNLYVVEVNSRIFILDAGMKYPDIDMYGIDQVIPNIDYLILNKDNIEGIFISHAHEDQIGAIPYLLKHLPTKVYGTNFAIAILEQKLKDNKVNLNNIKLNRINANRVIRFGDVSVSFFNTTHSIPESVGIAINTQDGTIVYCTDFNFSSLPNGVYQTTYDKITDLGKRKVLALLSESLSAGLIGRIPNDSLLEHNFNHILVKNNKRVFVGAYSTDLIRIQKIIDLSVEAGRKVCILSKKFESIIKVAERYKYINCNEESKLNISDYTKEELAEIDNVVFIVTGLRNEPYSALVKMLLDENYSMKLTKEDHIILMCPPLSGIEKYASDAINTLYEYDAQLTIFEKNILRSQHASPEDLKTLYAMLKPEYIVPIKGEYRHMYEQYLVAKSVGYDKSNICLLDNGEVISFVDGVLQEERESVKSGDIFIDGSSIGVVDNEVIAERTNLAEEGVIFIHIALDMRLRKLQGEISVSTKGFTHAFTNEELTNVISGLVEKMINNYLNKKTWNLDDVKIGICEEVKKLIFKFTRHRPIVVPVILEF